MLIYLDNNATTPTDPRVFEKMKPYFCERFGNPASTNHSFGVQAEDAVIMARRSVADLIGAKGKDIYFTSGATESNNLAIIGLLRKFKELHSDKIPHMITTNAEHKSVLENFELAQEFGATVSLIDVDEHGFVKSEDLKRAVNDNTILISVIFANNEVGTINNIEAIGKFAHDLDITFHTDAAQAAGKTPIDVTALNIDLLSISAHKMYGPKGVGALYVSPKLKIKAQCPGGSQEKGMRSGTLNVPGIVGLGEACLIAKNELEQEIKKLTHLRNHMITQITKLFPEAKLNGHPTRRLCNNISLSFDRPNFKLSTLTQKGLCLSAGSACSSKKSAPSYVLKSMGLSDELANSTIRIGLGRFTTAEEVATTLETLRRLTTPILKDSYDSSFNQSL